MENGREQMVMVVMAMVVLKHTNTPLGMME
jgi:hypothetical protein